MEWGSPRQRGELSEPLDGLGVTVVRHPVEVEQIGIELDEFEQTLEFALRGVESLSYEASGEVVEALGHWNPVWLERAGSTGVGVRLDHREMS